jgi:hypothetical protein
MEVELRESILAIVTTDRERVLNSSVPVFFAKDENEREKVSLLLSKITKAMVHDLENGCYVIVKH